MWQLDFHKMKVKKKNSSKKRSSKSVKTTSYTVKKGDSLYSIAKQFNTTVNKIKDKNLSNEIHKIMTTPHKPRRISKSLFIDYCNGKYRKEKKHGE